MGLTTALLAACAFGTGIPGLGTAQPAIQQAAVQYGSGLGGVAASVRVQAEQDFAAAAAAYVYGMPLETERQTVKGYLHNEIVNVNALATPDTQGVVSPNVDTAYSTAWVDLTDGPLVFDAPNSGGRFYTVQLMDAYTNAFAYVGSGTTGTGGGAFALVPPGWSGTLPKGVTKIQSPTNTVWLLARTLVDGPSDFPAVKQVQQQYELTPLAAWEAGVRDPSVTISQYPSGKKKPLPTGTAFISTLNQELTIDPPPAADDCALRALTPAGVSFSQPSAAQSLLADGENIAGVTPSTGSGDATATAAIDAGVAAGPQIVAAEATQAQAVAARGNHGWAIIASWIGNYGSDYLGRAIIGTDYLGANIPSQGIYPAAYTDVAGKPLDGSRDYTITFPKGLLPPAGAFWSLTMYGSDNYLYANPLSRYAIGNRTAGLVYGKGGSLTLYLQHAQPASAAARANWLPAPSGSFHLILRLYQPSAAALAEKWKPPPLFAPGELLRPALSDVRVSGRTVRYRDSQAATTTLTLGRHTLRHHDRAGVNTVKLPWHLKRAGKLRLQARGSAASYDNAASRTVTTRVRAARSTGHR